MRAILIDPTAKTVTALNFVGDYKDIQRIIDVECFTVISRPFIGKDDSLYLDDEGLLKDDSRFFMLDDYPQPLAGKALILGTLGDESTDCTVTLNEVIAKLTWVQTKFMGNSESHGEEDHPFFGKMMVSRFTPHFHEPIKERATRDNIA